MKWALAVVESIAMQAFVVDPLITTSFLAVRLLISWGLLRNSRKYKTLGSHNVGKTTDQKVAPELNFPENRRTNTLKSTGNTQGVENDLALSEYKSDSEWDCIGIENCSNKLSANLSLPKEPDLSSKMDDLLNEAKDTLREAHQLLFETKQECG